MDNRNEFIKELHALLEKYKIEISVGINGDTHGVSTWLDVMHQPDPKVCKYEEILTLNELTAHDLKPHIKP